MKCELCLEPMSIKKKSISIICGLILSAVFISCANQTEPKVEAQNNSNVRQATAESNHKSNTKPENKNELATESNAKSDKPIIKPSDINRELLDKKKANPKISAKELADYGNELIKKKGYNFSFYTCEIAEANKSAEDFSDTYRPFDYKLEDLTGRKITFQIMAKNFGHPCGCDFEIPVFQVSKTEMTVLADDQPLRLKRPKGFYLEEVELVDKSLKKSIRKWYKPFDIAPFGISKDGTKIYIETGYDDGMEGNGFINDLVLEISEDGTFQLVERNNSNIIANGEELKNFPKDPENSYLGYTRFKDGDKTYFIKFSYPCT